MLIDPSFPTFDSTICGDVPSPNVKSAAVIVPSVSDPVQVSVRVTGIFADEVFDAIVEHVGALFPVGVLVGEFTICVGVDATPDVEYPPFEGIPKKSVASDFFNNFVSD